MKKINFIVCTRSAQRVPRYMKYLKFGRKKDKKGFSKAWGVLPHYPIFQVPTHPVKPRNQERVIANTLWTIQKPAMINHGVTRFLAQQNFWLWPFMTLMVEAQGEYECLALILLKANLYKSCNGGWLSILPSRQQRTFISAIPTSSL